MPILQMRRLKFRKFFKSAKNHIIGNWQNHDAHPSIPCSKSSELSNMPFVFSLSNQSNTPFLLHCWHLSCLSHLFSPWQLAPTYWCSKNDSGNWQILFSAYEYALGLSCVSTTTMAQVQNHFEPTFSREQRIKTARQRNVQVVNCVMRVVCVIKQKSFALPLCPQDPAPSQTMEVAVAVAIRLVMGWAGISGPTPWASQLRLTSSLKSISVT